MSLRSIEFLKNLFSTGKKPAQADYYDVFDSYVHKDDVEVINSSVINEAISNYDTALKEVTEGSINTLGDVMQVLSGFSTSDDVREIIENLGIAPAWGAITGKPATRPVVWNEQVINLNTFPLSQFLPTGAFSLQTFSAVSYFFTEPGSKWLIVDIGMYNVVVAIKDPYSSQQVNQVVSCIRSITIAVNPRAAIL